MTDVLTPEQRRLNMSRIRGRDTAPEMLVRRVVHAAKFRYRLHRKDLPGCPDLVFVARRKIIFVHGCYWHMHDCRYGRVVPKTNAEFWAGKRRSNVERDARNLESLRAGGWDVAVVWECETRDVTALKARLLKFLKPTSPSRTRTPAARRLTRRSR